MTTKKYFYILAISTSAFLIQSCNKSEKVENTDKIEDVSSLEAPESVENTSLATDTSSNGATSSTDPKNIDKMLDDYEEYVDKYITYAKKIQAGDTSVMKEYTEIMEKANDYAESMDKIKDEDQITPEQMKRMLEIQAKMTGAIVTK
ncbi:hypothetical protein PFY12_00130 [Chryseobacterium camelliae]|uniref:DUF6591 domain-containing protein n=1 Tax=Chryseobacterium camelliae TaxID=1265445 RepID=A0ABY7QLH9_9FLAO|nr:DUF6591 domain-containing protein [Chryseobacterium camelliae]WBV60541.1 hypothetical protein PFY12_00130 [Chryseobacterium camelliae]